MASDRWTWDPSSRRYRDETTGRYLSQARVTELAERFINDCAGATRTLADRLISGELSLQAWTLEMRAFTSTLHLASYMLGRGGRNALEDADLARLNAHVREQWGFLQGFAGDIASGDVTPGRLAARAAMYAEAGTSSRAMGEAATYRGLRLPTYPGVGTDCRSRCRCRWEIREEDDRWRAFWRLGAVETEHCATCLNRAGQYAPYEQERAGVTA